MDTCKFDVGDIVRRIGFANQWHDGKMLKVGTICEVVNVYPFCDGFDIDVKVNGEVYKGNNYEYFELVEKKQTRQFKVGDKVIGNHSNTYGITNEGWVGEVKVVRRNMIEVYGAAHGCYMSFWVEPQYFDLYVEEPPKSKYYNGKVVCVENSYPGSLTISGFAVGKIYEVKDGKITSDDNWTCSKKYYSVETLCRGIGNTFIPIVE